jgi:hypothetical protein
MDLFKKLFTDYNLSEEEMGKFFGEFSVIALLTLVSNIKSELSSENNELIQTALENNKYDEIVSLLKNHYSEDELEALIKKHVLPLFDDYAQNVIKK